MIELAKKFATSYHAGQTRWDNETPYINHPADVVEILIDNGVTDEHIIAAAWLHDVVEDTTATIEDINDMFGFKVAYIVDTLTKNSDEEMFTKLSFGPADAALIKCIDRVCNLRDMGRMSKKKRVQTRKLITILAERLEHVPEYTWAMNLLWETFWDVDER